MKKPLALMMGMFGLLLLLANPASGDGKKGSYQANTGDKGLDLSLRSLDVEAKANLPGFIGKMSVRFGVPEAKVTDLVIKASIPPADVYMAFRIAGLIHKPVDVVIQEYNAHKGKGWGVIAKNLGIKPGSREFHALKDQNLLGPGNDNGGDKGPSKGKGKGKGKH